MRTSHAGAAAVLAALALHAVSCSRPATPRADPVQAAMRTPGAPFQSPSGTESRLLFTTYCATCHGEDGRGGGQNASRLPVRPPDLAGCVDRLAPAGIRRIVVGGTSAVGRSALCPPYGRTLSPEQVDLVVQHVARIAR